MQIGRQMEHPALTPQEHWPEEYLESLLRQTATLARQPHSLGHTLGREAVVGEQ